MTIDKWYVIDESLMRNPSVENLVRLMAVTYTLKTGEPRDIESRTPQRPQRIYVGQVNDVRLGFWPMEGPVEQIPSNPCLSDLFADGTLFLINPYSHDARSGIPMVDLTLTYDRKKLRRLGLDGFGANHAISLYLEPKDGKNTTR